jgi:hypothetical protein
MRSPSQHSRRRLAKLEGVAVQSWEMIDHCLKVESRVAVVDPSPNPPC